jgi:predicted flap endonuclease-1-like 5' DNA nuclease
MPSIIDIEGVGATYAEKLKAAGVKTTAKLLEVGGTPKGRKELAEKTGIGDGLILKWVNAADLFRIKGIAGQYSELLEAAGVDTVVELSKRKADNLHAKLTEVNDAKKKVRSLPSLEKVADWIKQAKDLPRAVKY